MPLRIFFFCLIMHGRGAMNSMFCLAPKNHVVLLSAQSNEFYPHLTLDSSPCRKLSLLPGTLLAPHPFPDAPLCAEPSWVHLKAAMLEFNPPAETSEQLEDSGCRLPELDPWDPSIRLWVKDWPPQYDKKAGIEDLLFVTMDTLHFNTTWLKRLKLDRKDINCNYSYIGAGASHQPEVPFEEDVLTLLPNYNSIWTRCVHGLKVLSTMTLFYVPPAISELNQTGDGVGAYSKSNFSRKMSGKRYSVTLLIIDSLSQMNIHRSLPKSLAQAEAMGGIMMSGHHKIGENSVPNMMGMMTGDKLYWTPGWVTSQNKTPETLPMIIGMFRDWGWSTVYFEDMIHWVGPALKYNVKVANPWTITYNDVWWYLRGSLAHNNPIQTISDMHLAHKELPSFLHIHLSEYLHDNLNMAKNYDADLAAMLNYLVQEKALEDTFVLLMGDHGYRMQGFTNLEQGKIENNMPGLIVIPPRDLQAQHPDWVKNLQANAEVLTSHWDIHHMFRQILGVAGGAEEVAKVYSHLKVPGESLLSPLAKRSCTAAGIALEYCSCPSGHRHLDPVKLP